MQIKPTSHTRMSHSQCWGISKAVPGNKNVSSVTVACSLGPKAPRAPVEGVTRKGPSTAAGHMSVLHTGVLQAISFVINKGGSAALETENHCSRNKHRSCPVPCVVMIKAKVVLGSVYASERVAGDLVQVR